MEEPESRARNSEHRRVSHITLAIKRPRLKLRRSREEELSEATRQRDGLSNELSQVEAKLSMARESIKEKTQRMKG